MTTLADESTDNLRAELERRERSASAPKPLVQSEWARLHKCIVEGVNELATTGRKPKDFDVYVFEAALEAVYGKDIWKWWNDHDY